ncbi:hypothetical protein IV203_031803 [Nitzschia inconspicua]|uniref:Uncharacterized protein n=1 Tax=Nitzschia inconspicua TaxID=303405 RepID=A0A9K3LWH1_9STRA|nr:hypothetical protein IV203_031803 [Nitzschia inconspicua]
MISRKHSRDSSKSSTADTLSIGPFNVPTVQNKLLSMGNGKVMNLPKTTYDPPRASTSGTSSVSIQGTASFHKDDHFSKHDLNYFGPNSNSSQGDNMFQTEAPHDPHDRDSGPVYKRALKNLPHEVTKRATVTPDDVVRPLVEINNPSLSMFMDDTMARGAPPLPNLHNYSEEQSIGQASSYGAFSDTESFGLEADPFHDIFSGLNVDLDEPIPLNYVNGQILVNADVKIGCVPVPSIETTGKGTSGKVGSIIANQTFAKAGITNEFPKTTSFSMDEKKKTASPKEYVGSFVNGQVYGLLKPVLPLPLELKPIILMLLEMEESGAPQAAIADACKVVKSTIRAMEPGVCGQTICEMIFVEICSNSGLSIDWHTYFKKAAKSEFNDCFEVEQVFLHAQGGEIRISPPPFIPTNLQLAVAYGVYYANEAKKFGMEHFVQGASLDINERMSPADKEAFWNQSSSCCGPRPPSLSNRGESSHPSP